MSLRVLAVQQQPDKTGFKRNGVNKKRGVISSPLVFSQMPSLPVRPGICYLSRFLSLEERCIKSHHTIVILSVSEESVFALLGTVSSSFHSSE
jgi:hypothetical protein